MALVRNEICFMAALAAAKRVFKRRQLLRLKRRGTRKEKSARYRLGRSVHSLYVELGPSYFKRAFRMTYESFQKLSSTLKDGIINASKRKVNSKNWVPNGRVTPQVRLACALRYMAGGSPYDLLTSFGISHTEVFSSLWFVIDAINNLPEFSMHYPASHEKQKEIAQEFQTKSAAQFDCCAGAIDGMLLWIHKPNKRECKKSDCASGKFLCGRKHKYGLNLQAVCDARGRFLDMSIVFPGSSSDCLAFEGSSLYQRLEEGILADGLCLFGDNAYINAKYMATPYSGVSGGTKDSYNFYHSQLRIRIECAFGMFVHRWSIFRKAMPVNMSIKKTVALTVAAAKLRPAT